MANLSGLLLHTNTYYASEKINTGFITRYGHETRHIDNEIASMEAKEEQLYRKFGSSDFEDFMNTISYFFTQEDLDALNGYSADSLNKSLDQFAGQYSSFYNEDVEIIVDTSKANEKLRQGWEELIRIFGQGKGGTVNGDKVSWQVNFSLQEAKKMLNQISARSHFREGSLNERATNILLKELTDENSGLITINKQNSQGEYVIPISDSIPNFPWGVTEEELEKGNRSPSFLEELKKAILRIKRFVCIELPKNSIAVQKAAMRVWDNTVMAQCENSSNLTPMFRLFQGNRKATFKSAVQGNLGEFQAALFFEFLTIKGEMFGLSSAQAQLLGNTKRHGEKVRTDVSIFDDIGLQVKNYSLNEFGGLGTHSGGQQVELGTKIHPDKFADTLDPSDGESFLQFISNYFFNASYQLYQAHRGTELALMSMIKQHLGAIMNMAVADNLEDTVTFYFIGGRYLVPGSVILREYKEAGLHMDYQLKCSYDAQRDQFYKDNLEAREKFWIKDLEGNWVPGQDNNPTAINLVTSKISFQTEFNPNSLLSRFNRFDIQNLLKRQ